MYTESSISERDIPYRNLLEPEQYTYTNFLRPRFDTWNLGAYPARLR
jgi:hypothetical protein